MGEVFEATHARLAGRYAVEVLAPSRGVTPESLQRFAREAKVTSSLRHPGIAAIIDFDTAPDGSPYRVVELLDGEDLGQVLGREGRLPLGRTIAITRQVASALAAAHRQDIVHGGLTPQNIFLLPAVDDEKERVKVRNFGMSGIRFASETPAGLPAVVGSQFTAPEQAEGRDDLDAAVDQFSLAAIVREMLAGRPAFAGDPLATVVPRSGYDEDPVPARELVPELPPGIHAVLARALSKNRALRFASIAEFSRELRIAAQTGGATAPAEEVEARSSEVTVNKAAPPRPGDAGAGGGSDARGGGREAEADGRPNARRPEESAPVVLQAPSLVDRAVLVPGGARATIRQTGAPRKASDELGRLGARPTFREVMRSPRARPVLGGVGALLLLVVVIALVRGGRSSAPTAFAGAGHAGSTVASGQASPGTPAAPGMAAAKTGPTIAPIVEPLARVDSTAATAPSEDAAPSPAPTARATSATVAAIGGMGGAPAGEPADLTFELASEPTGLPVWIDGKPYPDADRQAHTSTRGSLSAGVHRIEIVAKEGYEPWRKTVEIRADRANRFLARLKEKDPGEIFQELTPSPTAKPVATAQPATTPNAAGLVPAALKPPAPAPLASSGACALSVGSLPWASLWVDGQSTGQHTPAVALPLPCGKHLLRLKRDDQPIDFTTEIVLLPGAPLKRVFHFDAAGRRLPK